MSETNELPDDLGTQLVDILYSNTRLNYDVCAVNLVAIFEHLGKRLPDYRPLSQSVIDSIQNSVTDLNCNSDLVKLDQNLKNLYALNCDLQKGEKNFYECDHLIEKYLSESTQLLAKQTNLNVFKTILAQNRLEILNLFEMWQLSTNKRVKNAIIQLFHLVCHSDPSVVSLLYESIHLMPELFCQIKQDIALGDHASLIILLKFIIMLLINTDRRITQILNDYLKQTDFLINLFQTIESEKSFLFVKLNKNFEDYAPKNPTEISRSELQNPTLLDLFIHLVLALNNKFQLPEENLVINTINSSQEDRKYLSEIVINLINFESDPLLYYKIESLVTISNQEQEVFYYINPALKFISDLFSTELTRHTTGIFYLNDFNVLIDIIIRKLNNLSQTDQARVDYLSLIQLIIKNSVYKENLYRKNDFVSVFNSILKEPNETIDADIVRIILFENNNFK